MVNEIDDEANFHSLGQKAEEDASRECLMKKPLEEENSIGNSPTKKISFAQEINSKDFTDGDVEGCPYPLDIIVKKIHTVVSQQSIDSSDDEDYNTTKEINYALQRQGFKVVEKENGADCEIITFDPAYPLECPEKEGAVDALKPSSSKRCLEDMAKAEGVPIETNNTTTVKGKFKQGHRRAYSMPNHAHGRDRAVLVVADDKVRQEGARKRHVVRYRLHPYKPSAKTNAAVNSFIESTNFDMQFNLDENDAEFEMDMDEEEIVCYSGMEDQVEGKKSRLVLKRFWEAKWKRQNFEFLPDWLQDNEFLRTGHRPPMASFGSCFKSIFSVHTETGNIWTHMYGGIAFIGVAAWFLAQSPAVIAWREKIIFSFFFFGAICCLGMSFAFHTVSCHSQGVGRLFSKLDYAGISLLIVGSFIPWIFYGFYCRTLPKVIYISMIVVFGIAALIVSLWEKFAQPAYRPLRAGVFLAMGLSGVIPAFHLLFTDGLSWVMEYASFHWLVLMAVLYVVGALIYAFRFPERCFPGKCDLFCQSHQIFHLFVIVAAFVHFHGITEMTMKRLEGASCTEQLMGRYGNAEFTNVLDKWFRPV
ncbi:hemolysin-III related domain-containing protein [Ditylenchus destructor]|uniref:Hemolysin-III related domain-containing protein n=1 Tax=Ditylenchus destructor TaxID=166010 RepID=A0AAD4MRG9_9BILA|nr:hemolysin-III related domain-containing protein [Ditylenchus destructor]